MSEERCHEYYFSLENNEFICIIRGKNVTKAYFFPEFEHLERGQECERVLWRLVVMLISDKWMIWNDDVTSKIELTMWIGFKNFKNRFILLPMIENPQIE